MGAALLVAGLTLVLSLLVVAAPALEQPQHFFSAVWAPQRGFVGVLGLLVATLGTSLLALTVAAPVALGTSIYLTQLAPHRARAPLKALVHALAVVPPVVYGLWGATVLFPHLRVVEPALRAVLGDPSGVVLAVVTAALVLAIMATPTISAASMEAMSSAPRSLSDAALALGATRWEAIRLGVLPHAARGVMGSIALGLARAMGEAVAVALMASSFGFAPLPTLASVLLDGPRPLAAPLAVAALLLVAVTGALGVGARRLLRGAGEP